MNCHENTVRVGTTSRGTPRSTFLVPHSPKEGGAVIIANHAHGGQAVHMWAGRWGTAFGGGGWSAGKRARHLAKASRVAVYPYAPIQIPDEAVQHPLLSQNPQKLQETSA